MFTSVKKEGKFKSVGAISNSLIVIFKNPIIFLRLGTKIKIIGAYIAKY